MNRQKIIDLLKTKVTKGHEEWWMTAQLVAFKGKTADEMISEGKAQMVYDFFLWAF